MVAKLFCVVFVLLPFVHSAKKPSYELIMEKFEIITQNPEYTKVEARIHEFEGKQCVSCNFTLLRDMPPLDVTMNANAFYAGKYNPVPFNIEKTVCELLENEFKLVEGQLKDANIPRSCPVKKGDYYIKNFVPSIAGLPIPSTIPWNKFLMNVKVTNSEDNAVVAAMDYYIRLEKKGAKTFG